MIAIGYPHFILPGTNAKRGQHTQSRSPLAAQANTYMELAPCEVLHAPQPALKLSSLSSGIGCTLSRTLSPDCRIISTISSLDLFSTLSPLISTGPVTGHQPQGQVPWCPRQARKVNHPPVDLALG